MMILCKIRIRRQHYDFQDSIILLVLIQHEFSVKICFYGVNSCFVCKFALKEVIILFCYCLEDLFLCIIRGQKFSPAQPASLKHLKLKEGKIFQKPGLAPFCTENPILNVEITVYPNFYKWQKYPFNTGLFFHVCVYERSIPMHRDLLQSFQTNRDYTSKLPIFCPKLQRFCFQKIYRDSTIPSSSTFLSLFKQFFNAIDALESNLVVFGDTFVS